MVLMKHILELVLKEAYINEYDYDYLSKRKHYSWFKFIKNN